MLRFVLVAAAGILSYVDRQALAILVVQVQADCSFSSERYGYIVGAFSLAYSIGNPLWGFLIDRFGIRRVLSFAVAVWSVASSLHATVNTFLQLLILRLLLGLAQGATFPAGVRAASSAFRGRMRGRGVGFAYSGGPIGAIITPLLIAPIALKFGWRVAFAMTGVAGLLWLTLWWYRSSPHADEEKSSSQPTTAPSGAASLSLLRDRRAWSAVAAYALGGFPLAFVLNDGPLYLHLHHHLATSAIATLFWAPPLGWACGFFFWGYAYDWLRAREFNPTSSCRYLLSIATLMGCTLALVPAASNVVVAVILMGIALFATPGFVTVTLAWTGSSFPEQLAFLTGTGAGFWSAVVALLMPALGRLFDHGRTDIAFIVATLMMPVALLTWLMANGRRYKGTRMPSEVRSE